MYSFAICFLSHKHLLIPLKFPLKSLSRRLYLVTLVKRWLLDGVRGGEAGLRSLCELPLNWEPVALVGAVGRQEGRRPESWQGQRHMARRGAHSVALGHLSVPWFPHL